MSIWKPQKKGNESTGEFMDEEHNEVIFLDCLAAKQAQVQIFLMGGIRITGKLTGSDEFSILITTEKQGDQMIYKHSIATICLDLKKE